MAKEFKLQQVVLFVSLQWEMQKHQTFKHYFHLCNAHLICLSKIVVIAWLRVLEIFRNVVAESKEGDFIHPAVILFFSSTPSMTPHIRH